MPDPPRRAGVEFPPLERQGAGAAPRGGCFPARGSIHPRPLRQGRLLASRAVSAGSTLAPSRSPSPVVMPPRLLRRDLAAVATL